MLHFVQTVLTYTLPFLAVLTVVVTVHEFGHFIVARMFGVAVDRFSYATAAKLFDVGGASATQSIYNLDRHWRNIRTISTHNPTFLKASAIGDNLVSGTDFPANAYF